MSKQDRESEASMYEQRMSEDATARLKAAGAVELPKDPEEARKEVMRLTQDFKQVWYWTPKPQSWLDRKLGVNDPPYGMSVKTRELTQCRPYDEVAIVIYEAQLWEQSLVKLRYEDKVEIILEIEKLHLGLRMTGNAVRRKFVPCRPGERDVMGVLHKKL